MRIAGVEKSRYREIIGPDAVSAVNTKGER
jgi:hypothetical protein